MDDIVAVVRGPDARLMAQLREGVTAIRAQVDIQVAARPGILSPEQADERAAQLGELGPDEVPLNFLNPRPGTPFGDLPVR